jgi:hypothetical protein
MDTPSREKVLESVLRGLSRRETPMRYVAVQRLRGMLYNMSDAQYAEFMRRAYEFDPEKIDPEIKKRMIADAQAADPTGAIATIVETGLESVDLLREGKKLLTEMAP